ncbi:MAG: SDR family oxidoreductase [Kordiimonadaceae bacterium]|nr:SDR family oxidoreductase [Kordiimonadaceae bacterium]MBO6567989.1 SDR family oxidoreductase [Kordiimonadaceae bacterium]MBO6964281.1 SDR family oxidoreductase [Kordiimonadaceae bacterium]
MTQKIALITGGSRGLGRSIAQHLAQQGVGVVLTYLNQSDAAHSVVADIQATGGQAIALQLDTSNTSGFAEFKQTLIETIQAAFGRDRIDYLVNNAGFGVHASIADTSEADLYALFSVHVKGPFFLTQTLLDTVEDGGHIINLSSGLARFSLNGYSAYAMMKGAIEVFTRYLAQELGPREISVNTIAPGAIETDFGGGAVRDNKDVNGFVASVTAKGRAGLPDDVGGAVASLLTGTNSWITAQRIEVSGGMNI